MINSQLSISHPDSKEVSSNPSVAIIQSNFLPWRGYFDIIDDVDIMVLFDDVQYPMGRSFRNRNKIKTSTGPQWITVPVLSKSGHQQNVEEVEICYDRDWVKKISRSIEQSYAAAPYFKDYSVELFSILESRPTRISQLNCQLIEWACRILDIRTKLVWSNQFPSTLTKTARLLDILNNLGAKSYLSGPSAKSYIDPKDFENAQVILKYKVYDYESYPQLFNEFSSDVSIIDLIFNCGPESKSHLKSLGSNEKN